ncbi:endonuclease/exonuclease/phosphatase family protein [Microvirga puerhi]|uniref:Endonuclease/exonuclease/phosphatase family protein n=1 Tax=Microvirga puerhi TaxID=2876078 RepID=A0ABS7VLJ5_9HYPH|nr:endonuclease/exonuclease/phosphatase family protein [Microvirga puerhi]MBZ6076391.1 endonuclease/exonuclease/phosphatase family protein [Microvirga puerhi]
MRPLIQTTIGDLPAPESDLLAEARNGPPTPERHAEFLHAIPAFHRVEQRPTSTPLAWPGYLRIAAFNAERLKRPDAARALLDASQAHVALLSEVDLGMARSGNGHPLREIIGATGEGYAYGVEFVELDLGDPIEMRRHAGERNARSFHGNAIVSKLAFDNPCIIPLEESGFWFPGKEGAQRRVGGRIAVAVRLTGAPRPLWVAAVHLESKTNPDDRRMQIQHLLNGIEAIDARAAWVIGGDFNTKSLPRDRQEARRLLEIPERDEPLFDDLRRAGFTWASANLPLPTQRTGPQNKPQPPFGKLDWIVVRGLQATDPQILPALDGEGQPISDHDMVVADLFFEGPE